MMLNHKWLVLFLCTFLLGACTVTGPADDGFDRDNEWVDNGRLGLNDIKKIFPSEQNQASDTPSVNPVKLSSVTLEEQAEFEQFKIWNKLKAEGVASEDYREFLQWLNYQKFKTGQ